MNTAASGSVFSASWLRGVCILLCLGITIAGLWPLTLWPQNEVEWLPGENGIRFNGRGLIYRLDSGMGAAPSSRGRDSITVDLWLRPAREPHLSLPVFLTLYDPASLDAVAFAQWEAELIVRWQNLNGPLVVDEIGIEDVLHAGQRSLLTITCDASGTGVFVDGRQRRRYPANLLSRSDARTMEWVLGNTPDGRRPWQGDVFAIATYDRALSAGDVLRNHDGWSSRGRPITSRDEGLVGLFIFSERSGEITRSQIRPDDHFRVAKFLEVRIRNLLITPWKDFEFTQGYLVDMALNILGFVPLGFFLAAYFVKSCGQRICRAIFLTIFVAAALSLSIEIIQAWIPSRDSQLMDLLMNMAGTAVGSLVYFAGSGDKRGSEARGAFRGA